MIASTRPRTENLSVDRCIFIFSLEHSSLCPHGVRPILRTGLDATLPSWKCQTPTPFLMLLRPLTPRPTWTASMAVMTTRPTIKARNPFACRKDQLQQSSRQPSVVSAYERSCRCCSPEITVWASILHSWKTRGNTTVIEMNFWAWHLLFLSSTHWFYMGSLRIIYYYFFLLISNFISHAYKGCSVYSALSFVSFRQKHTFYHWILYILLAICCLLVAIYSVCLSVKQSRFWWHSHRSKDLWRYPFTTCILSEILIPPSFLLLLSTCFVIYLLKCIWFDYCLGYTQIHDVLNLYAVSP